jgi:hypothetical protein
LHIIVDFSEFTTGVTLIDLRKLRDRSAYRHEISLSL